MGIDLTGSDEQDWLGGEEAPPIRYSELATDEERDSAVVEQLREPVSEVLSEWFSDRGYTTVSSSVWKIDLATRTVLGWYEETDETPPISDLLDSVERPETSDSEWMERYLRDVAEAVVEETPDEMLEFIGSEMTVQNRDSDRRSRPRMTDAVSDQTAIGNHTQNRRLE